MKKSFTVFLLLFAVAVLFYAPEPASADIFFQLSNKSGRTFNEIWVGPSSNGHWLDRDKFRNSDGTSTRLSNGRYITLWPNMAGRQDVQYWDLKVVTSDGRKHEWHEAEGIVAADYNLSLTLINNSGWTFRRVYLFPTQRHMNVISDRLDMPPLKNEHSVEISDHFKNQTSARRNCRYWDLMVEYRKGGRKVWTGLDLAEIRGITIDGQWTAHFTY